jgi:uncharacterized protein YjbI with pentapeptide repeats
MVDFEWVNLRKANLKWTNLREANLKWADLTKASLIEANLKEAHYLTFDQLSKMKTFHDAKLNKKPLNSLKKNMVVF